MAVIFFTLAFMVNSDDLCGHCACSRGVHDLRGRVGRCRGRVRVGDGGLGSLRASGRKLRHFTHRRCFVGGPGRSMCVVGGGWVGRGTEAVIFGVSTLLLLTNTKLCLTLPITTPCLFTIKTTNVAIYCLAVPAGSVSFHEHELRHCGVFTKLLYVFTSTLVFDKQGR